ncbi:MAG: tetratricopeptide repeat protein [Bacteroidia bacterium]|nr:tetratricopeptide repeat protein [Bacteroidia bacterium]
MLLFYITGFSQSPNVFDKKEKELINKYSNIIKDSNSNDTLLANAYVELSNFLYRINPDTLVYLCEKGRLIAEKNISKYPVKHPSVRSLKKSLSTALNNMGFYREEKGDILSALEFYLKCVKIDEELDNKEALGYSYCNLGVVYKHLGDVEAALEFYEKSLKIREEIGDKNGMADSYSNIGVVHQNHGDLETALKYFHKSLAIDEEIKNNKGMGSSNANIGFVHSLSGDLKKALEYYNKSLVAYKAASDKAGMAEVYNYMGTSYKRLVKTDNTDAVSDSMARLSLMYFQKSYALDKEFGDSEGMSKSMASMGLLFLEAGNALGLSEKEALAKAKEMGEAGLKLAKEVGGLYYIMANAAVMNQVYKKEGKWKEAYEMYTLQVSMNDSVNSENNLKASAKQNIKYEYDKREAIKDKEHENEILLSTTREEKQRTYTLIGLAASVLLVAFLIFVFNRLKITRKQKNKIELQRKEIEQTHQLLSEHHKEIQDSIAYAKRIQDAILPSMASMNKALKNGFVLYRPKDVVAGDFFWMENYADKIFFAAADCTGHGVPGAMVSMICSNALSKALLEEKPNSTGDLLDKTRDIVIKQMAKSGDMVKDGMDISLCAIDFRSMRLQWSGANNPLWILRKNESAVIELLEFKPDKQPIGLHDHSTIFTSHDITLQKGDIVYVFTDGFQDQFGGERGKKFKASQMKEKLKAFYEKEMDEQKILLEKEFEKWKGALDQVDDVCIIGLKV